MPEANESRISRISRSPRLHPILFAAYPVLYLWGENAQEGNRGDALILLAIAVVVAIGAVWVLGRLLFASVEKAAVATSTAVILFFSFGRVYGVLYPTGLFIARQRFLLPLFGALLVWIWVALLRRPASPGRRSRAFNTVAAALLALAILKLLGNVAPTVGRVPDIPRSWDSMTSGIPRGEMPDVYYLILDGYGRQDVLHENFGFDNSHFLDGLRERGFFIAEESLSNYQATALSLSSSLNLGYLHGPNGVLMDARPDGDVLRELMRNNRLFRLLGQAGYSRYVIAPRENFLPSLDPPEELADCGSSREFFEAFLQTTMARVWRNRWGGFTAEQRRRTVMCQFEALASVARKKGPKLVFFHSMLTHPPFLFHRDGSPRKVRDVVARKWRPWRPGEHYVDQIVLANRLVGEVVDSIIERAPDAVIVIQGDHGPAGSKDWGDDIAGEYRERFGILNAIRMAPGEALAYGGITPVNTFRILLRERFGVAIEVDDDRSFFLDERGGGAFVEVTDQIHGIDGGLATGSTTLPPSPR